MVRSVRAVLFLALVLFPVAAFAQVGNIAGTVRDSQGGVLPGVTVEVSSPQLIEKVRSTTTDGNGRYQIVSLPVGTYKVTFKLEKFSTFERGNIELTSDFTAPVNAELKIGTTAEVVTVTGTSAPLVDVQNARQRQVFTGEEIRDLPTTRDLPGILNLVPGIAVQASGFGVDGNSTPRICDGGAGDFVASNGFGFTGTGGQSGCSPVINGFNAHTSMNQGADLDRGRLQVDGMNVMGVSGGGAVRYMADIQNAQEVTFTLSGSLGESETGGTTINVVPRTGGNRYAGNYFWSYADQKFYGRNEGTRTRSSGLSFNNSNQLDHDFDNNASFGGPIIRNRLWFQSSARYRGVESYLPVTYYNQNEGIFGANFLAARDRLAGSTSTYRSANTRLTVQATTKNKLNVFWDEQYTCENPCTGTMNFFTSPEAQGSQLTYPSHVAQLRWTNPYTNNILLDGGVTWNAQHTDQTRNRSLPAYTSIPRVSESGQTAYAGFGNTTGSLNNAPFIVNNVYQMTASAGYVTGSHNAKIGWQGSIYSQNQRNAYNDMRLNYAYATPGTTAASCVAGLAPPAAAVAPLPGITTNPATSTTWCGLLMGGAPNPNDSPDSLRDSSGRPTCLNATGDAVCRFPVPTTVTEFIPNKVKQQVMSNAIYIQDQWTFNRFTFNGALRYDNAHSNFPETCVGPDLYYTRQYCLNSPDAEQGKDGKGVRFQDITPRWGVAWDIFGNGKTSLKWNMGKYVAGAGVGGIYTAANPASPTRSSTQYARTWTDLDGDRIPDCDLQVPVVAPASSSFPNSGECGGISNVFEATNTARRFGRSPDELDEAGQAIGLATIQCGRNDSSRIDQSVIDYCGDYFSKGGESLLQGWGKRQYEWQFGLGIQHELLPRMSIEVTYNRRDSYNQQINDQIRVGCDLYQAPVDPDTCMTAFRNWENPSYDFFAVRAPIDANLPAGGGYVIPGFLDRKPGTAAAPAGAGFTAVTLDKDHRIKSHWQGVDVNVTLRARGGIRISGGTSTGAQYVNNCNNLSDGITTTSVILRQDGIQACTNARPFQTNVRGTATYTIPWVDVLLSSTFSYRPGVSLSANYTYSLADLIWMEGSEYRSSYGSLPGQTACNSGTTTVVTNVGCLLSNVTGQTFSANLLPPNVYGEGIRIMDVKLAKNIRFNGKRVNFGMDIYNVFNSDAALQYCSQYPVCTITGQGQVSWPNVTGLTTPRYARFQMQVDF